MALTDNINPPGIFGSQLPQLPVDGKVNLAPHLSILLRSLGPAESSSGSLDGINSMLGNKAVQAGLNMGFSMLSGQDHSVVGDIADVAAPILAMIPGWGQIAAVGLKAVGAIANKINGHVNDLTVAQSNEELNKMNSFKGGATDYSTLHSTIDSATPGVYKKKDFGSGILGRNAFKKYNKNLELASQAFDRNVNTNIDNINDNQYMNAFRTATMAAYGGPIIQIANPFRYYAEGGDMEAEQGLIDPMQAAMMQQVQQQMAGEGIQEPPQEGQEMSLEEMQEEQSQEPQETQEEEQSQEPLYEEGKVYDVSKEEYKRLIDEGYEVEVIKK